MAEQIEPWNLPWLKQITAEEAPELREEGLQMIADLPEVDPATIHPTSEVVVRAPSLAPEQQPIRPTLPWEIEWDIPQIDIGGQFAADLPTQAEEPAAPRSLNQETSQIASDEGTRVNGNGDFISYKDRGDNITGGIGHLLTPEEIKMYPEGTVIPTEVSDQWFIVDMDEAEADADALIGKQSVPDEVRLILTNMAFNLGKTRLKKFTEMWKAIKREDWEAAANEMVDSDWFKQVGTRSERLVERMLSV
jgi:lysozyme